MIKVISLNNCPLWDLYTYLFSFHLDKEDRDHLNVNSQDAEGHSSRSSSRGPTGRSSRNKKPRTQKKNVKLKDDSDKGSDIMSNKSPRM